MKPKKLNKTILKTIRVLINKSLTGKLNYLLVPSVIIANKQPFKDKFEDYLINFFKQNKVKSLPKNAFFIWHDIKGFELINNDFKKEISKKEVSTSLREEVLYFATGRKADKIKHFISKKLFDKPNQLKNIIAGSVPSDAQLISEQSLNFIIVNEWPLMIFKQKNGFLYRIIDSVTERLSPEVTDDKTWKGVDWVKDVNLWQTHFMMIKDPYARGSQRSFLIITKPGDEPPTNLKEKLQKKIDLFQSEPQVMVMPVIHFKDEQSKNPDLTILMKQYFKSFFELLYFSLLGNELNKESGILFDAVKKLINEQTASKFRQSAIKEFSDLFAKNLEKHADFEHVMLKSLFQLTDNLVNDLNKLLVKKKRKKLPVFKMDYYSYPVLQTASVIGAFDESRFRNLLTEFKEHLSKFAPAYQ